MKFDELDQKMRYYETYHDACVPAEYFLIARLDGRSFTKLTKKRHDFEKPFDTRFRDMMWKTTEHLMQCGFRIVYGYVQSDEISLLFHPDEQSFARKTRKLNSVLAGEASGCFSLELGEVACFDCRLSLLPEQQLVVDYFRWRNEDAHRNALSAYCYWKLREEGKSASKATSELMGLSIAEKKDFLQAKEVDFSMIPSWQQRGVGYQWQEVEKEAWNPKTEEKVVAKRNQLTRLDELPVQQEYSTFLQEMLARFTQAQED